MEGHWYLQLLAVAFLICNVPGVVPKKKSKRSLIVAGIDKDATARYSGYDEAAYDLWESDSEIRSSLETISSGLNENFENSEGVEKFLIQHPKLKKIVAFSEKGYTCNEDLCDEFGDGVYSMGVCSQHYCDCGSDRPKPLTCDGKYKAFNPVTETCQRPNKIKLCKF